MSQNKTFNFASFVNLFRNRNAAGIQGCNDGLFVLSLVRFSILDFSSPAFKLEPGNRDCLNNENHQMLRPAFLRLAFLRPALLFLLAVLGLSIWSNAASADIIHFRLTGLGGDGLLASNVHPHTPTNPGSGGIGVSGIFIDTETNTLHVDVAWGSGNGFSDLSSNVVMLHLHGFTANPAPASFNELNPNVIINLGNSLNFDGSATNGSMVDDFFVSNAEIQGMVEGRSYINVHTSENPDSELRGYLVVAVPEPASGGLLLLAGVMALRFRRRK